jgi:hypothetical protein
MNRPVGISRISTSPQPEDKKTTFSILTQAAPSIATACDMTAGTATGNTEPHAVEIGVDGLASTSSSHFHTCYDASPPTPGIL